MIAIVSVSRRGVVIASVLGIGIAIVIVICDCECDCECDL